MRTDPRSRAATRGQAGSPPLRQPSAHGLPGLCDGHPHRSLRLGFGERGDTKEGCVVRPVPSNTVGAELHQGTGLDLLDTLCRATQDRSDPVMGDTSVIRHVQGAGVPSLTQQVVSASHVGARPCVCAVPTGSRNAHARCLPGAVRPVEIQFLVRGPHGVTSFSRSMARIA